MYGRYYFLEMSLLVFLATIVPNPCFQAPKATFEDRPRNERRWYPWARKVGCIRRNMRPFPDRACIKCCWINIIICVYMRCTRKQDVDIKTHACTKDWTQCHSWSIQPPKPISATWWINMNCNSFLEELYDTKHAPWPVEFKSFLPHTAFLRCNVFCYFLFY